MINNDNDPNGNFFVGLIANEPIKTVIMNEDVGHEIQNETVGWDDIQFGVPEPATLALMLAGLALAARRRR